MSSTKPPEIVEVDAHAETVGCDGGGGALGHPMVYYSFGTKDAVDCGYCGRRFVKQRDAQPQQDAQDAEAQDSEAAAE